MNSGRLLTLWSCHHWEDFPLEQPSSDAASLLACWTALWHPVLLLRSGTRPAFWRVDRADELTADDCVAIPQEAARKIDATVRQRLEQEAIVLEGVSRQEVFSHLARHGIAIDPPGHAAGFFALGYAWLQVHLMTRSIRFSDGIDDPRFTADLLAAADAWHNQTADDSPAPGRSADKADAVHAALQKCFDQLLAERKRYYPADANLYRIVLGRPVIDAGKLVDSIATGPCSLIASPSDLETVERTGGPAWKELRGCLVAGNTAWISGGWMEVPEPLAGCGTAVRNLLRGWESASRIAGREPGVLGRRSGGHSRTTPAIASAAGWSLGLGCPFDSRRAPLLSAPAAQWKSPCGTAFQALSTVPLAFSDPSTFLRLGAVIAEQADSWHASHLLLAHWPGSGCESRDDLEATMKFGNLLGRYRTLDQAAGTIQPQSWGECPEADALDEAVLGLAWPEKPRTAKQLRDYWRLLGECQMLRRAAVLLTVAGVSCDAVRERLDNTRRAIDGLASADLADLGAVNQIQDTLHEVRAWICGSALQPGGDTSAASRPALLLLNATTSPLVESVVVSEPSPGETAVIEPPLRLFEQAGAGTRWLVKPADSSLALLQARPGTAKGRRPLAPQMIDGKTLRNEFLTVDLDPETGAIQSIRRAGSSVTLASQRLSYRERETPGGQIFYRNQSAESIRSVDSGRIAAAIQVSGQLGSHARFEQAIRLVRLQPWVVLDITIEPLQPIQEDFWSTYFCSRLAWRNPDAPRFRYHQAARERCCLQRFTSPVATEIELDDDLLTLMTFGNAWHQQSALNFLDTLLVGDEAPGSGGKFRLAIGINIADPLAVSESIHAGPLVLESRHPRFQKTGRLVEWKASGLDWYDGETVDAEGKPTVRFDLREVLGRGGQATLSFAQPPETARMLDPAGNPLTGASLDGNSVRVQYNAWQLFSVEVGWNRERPV